MAEAADGVLHMIGNAHLDPVWLWRWQEGFQAAKSTFRSALHRLRESDDFLFTSSSAALYEWIERNDPDMFEEIRSRVAEGRWEICGGWWIQPDCNLPGGESFVRQGLYGQRYLKEKLGVTAVVGYNPDSFGHAASLPQILLKSGLSSYVFMRPHPHEQRLPSRLFWWESDDGSRVLTFRIPYEYCTWGKDLEQHVLRCAAELGPWLRQLMCFYGVGNHGGGPTRENIESIRRLQAAPGYPTLVFSTPGRYFASIDTASLPVPVVHDELQHHASGCYAAHSGIKRWNRRAEGLLMTAETLCALASCVADLSYPRDFDRAWKAVLFNQFHDILAGTSVESAYDDARDLFGEAMAIASRNLNDAAQSISWRIGIEGAETCRPVVVFNPHSWPVQRVVEHEIGRVDAGDLLLDPTGEPVPLQLVRSEATVASGSRNRMCFLATVPPLGYTVYRLTAGDSARSFPSLRASDHAMENDSVRLEISPETGCIASLFDKREGFEWFRREGAKGLVLSDHSDTWSHGVFTFDDVVGVFAPVSVQLVEHGPVKSVIRAHLRYGASRLTQDFTLYRELAHIDVAVAVDWHEHFAALKLHFPLNLDFVSLTYEVPYGHVERPANGEEEPGQTWIDLTGIGRGNGKRLGMSLVNDAKYSYDVRDCEMNLTVLRSPIYAHHVPYVPEPDREYSFIDQGFQRFTYSLMPHAGGWQDAGTVKRAAELNRPLVPQVESVHEGPLPLQRSYLSVDADSVVVPVIKRAEDGNGLVLRCVETSGRPAVATIRMPRWGRTFQAQLGPSEIKTLLVPDDESAPVRETSLIELES